MKKLFNKLNNYIDRDDITKSSHWKFYTKNYDFKLTNSSFGVAGFGTASKKNLLKIIYHFFFQRLLFFRNNIFNSDYYYQMKKVCLLQNRNLNLDSLRHVFTHRLIDKYITDSKNKICCCIGDGRTNYIAPLLINQKFKKIISINLPEILIADLKLLENIIDVNKIKIIENEDDYSKFIDDPDIKLLLIPSKLNYILNDKKIDFFINIASFQEMKNSTVNDYFKIIKSNKSLFYCCNREYKELIGGEVLDFKLYEWGENKSYFHEYCPWHNYYYSIVPPFFLKYDGKIIHTLVDYSGN